jgi:peptidoglycan/xylan/chitin deacetylase (PgdA/CDA1 family)
MSPVLFDAQMAFLSRYRRVVPLSEVIDQVRSGVSPPAGTVCITFDDGYLDNLTIAAPILAKYKLPATLYLATGYIERGEAQWADSLYWLFRRRTKSRLQIPSLQCDAADLASSASRGVVLNLLHRHLLETNYQERKQLLDEIERQLAPNTRQPQLTMNWDDVRALCRRYPTFEIGGHTRNHIDLRKHFCEDASSEITGCAEDVQREIGVFPRHFSFPYGRWCIETQKMVIAMGWFSAVGISTTVRADHLSDPFAISRVEAPQSMTELRFKTSGAYPGILSSLRIG